MTARLSDRSAIPAADLRAATGTDGPSTVGTPVVGPKHLEVQPSIVRLRDRRRPRPSDRRKLVADHQRILPLHVQACQHSELTKHRWFMWSWDKQDPRLKTRVPYSCGSWRCEVCSRHEAAVTFSRIREAVMRDQYAAKGWIFLVLTLDREGYYGGRTWPRTSEAYRELSRMSRNLLSRIRREYGGLQGNAWVAVTEAHRDGWPHMNLLLYCPELAARLDREQAELHKTHPEILEAVHESQRLWREKKTIPLAVRELARQSRLIRGDLGGHIVETGWGPQSTAETVRDREALASYIVKLVGEVSKITQAPTNAPVRFRRLRSGKRFLLPRQKREGKTGVLVRRRRSREGDWEILGVNPPKDPSTREAVSEALHAEQQIIEEEENALAANGGRAPPVPPVRLAVADKAETLAQSTRRTWRESALRLVDRVLHSDGE